MTHQSYQPSGKCHQNIDCCLRLEARVEKLRSIKAAIQNDIKVLSSRRFQLDHDVAKLKLLKHTPLMNGDNHNQDKLSCQCEKDSQILRKTILHQRSQIALQNDLLANLHQTPANAQHQLPHCKPININLTWKSEPSKKSLRDCNLQRCFRYDRCPINKIFTAYIYSYDNYSILNSRNLQSLPFVTRNACLYVVIVNSTATTQTNLHRYLHSLPSWHQHGKNHLLIDIGWTIKNLLAVNVGYAMVAGANFASFMPRMKFDIVIPPIQLYSKSYFMNVTPLQPQFAITLQREYLLHFQGQAMTNNSINQHLQSQLNSLSTIAKSIEIKVDIQTQCRNMNKLYYYHKFEWSLCVDNSYIKRLQKSTFTIIFLHSAPCASTLVRLIQALVSGSIPVFITDYSSRITLDQILPLAEYLDWNLAGVILPSVRLPEIAKVLVSIPNSDIVKKRLQGQFFYHTYFSKSDKILHATLALLRTRLQLPAHPIDQYVQKHYPDKLTLAHTININKANLLIPSLSYVRNFSSNWYNMWNNAPGPYWRYPFNADNTFLPTDSQFNGFGKGFQPINGGGTAFGKSFNRHLGGNYPLEQFTIVILTHNRPKILRQRLIHLSNISYLNKIVVVWNEYDKYAKTFQWPHFDIPIYVSFNYSSDSIRNIT